MFPLNKIPVLKSGGLIVNTDPHTLPGEHWIAIYINKYEINVFDPLGFYYPDLLVKTLMKGRQNRNIIYNQTQYQDWDTNTCGQYCLIWLKEMTL